MKEYTTYINNHGKYLLIHGTLNMIYGDDPYCLEDRDTLHCGDDLDPRVGMGCSEPTDGTGIAVAPFGQLLSQRESSG